MIGRNISASPLATAARRGLHATGGASRPARPQAAKHIWWLLVLFLYFGGQARDAFALPQLDAARVRRIEAMLPDRPVGFGPVCADLRAWGTPEVAARLRPVIAEADSLLFQGFPAWSDATYLEFSRTGARTGGEHMITARNAWLYPLVLAECATNSGRYLPAIGMLLASLDDQPTWTWPASDGKLTNFRDHDYRVDLLSADMANEIAQTLYMLGDKIPPSLREKTLRVMEKRVFQPFLKTVITDDGRHSWLNQGSNWTAVCLKGVVAAALAVLPSRHERAVFATAGEQYIRTYENSFTPDGYTCEGPWYWNYGFSHFILLREILNQATSGQLDIFAGQPKIRAMAFYGYGIEMFPGNVATFGDAAPHVRLDDFSRSYVNQVFAFGQPQTLGALPIKGKPAGTLSPLVTTILQLFGSPAPLRSMTTPPLSLGLHTYFDAVGVLISRPGPGERLAVSIKADGNGSHSHNDIGSYSIGLGQEQPTGDPGVGRYSEKTFGRDRYLIDYISSYGHSVPVIDGYLQREATTAKPRVLATRFTDAQDTIIIDLASAYQVADIRRLTRQLRHDRGAMPAVILEDRFDFGRPMGFEEAIICSGNWKRVRDDTLELWQKNEHILARIEASVPVDITSRTVNEDGLVFTRIAIRMLSPQSNGSVRIRYTPKQPAPTGSAGGTEAP